MVLLTYISWPGPRCSRNFTLPIYRKIGKRPLSIQETPLSLFCMRAQEFIEICNVHWINSHGIFVCFSCTFLQCWFFLILYFSLLFNWYLNNYNLILFLKWFFLQDRLNHSKEAGQNPFATRQSLSTLIPVWTTSEMFGYPSLILI